jgi:hypothetical protein
MWRIMQEEIKQLISELNELTSIIKQLIILLTPKSVGVMSKYHLASHIEVNRRFLDEYNMLYSTKLKSSAGWEKNAQYWLTIYSEDEIIEAIRRIKDDPFWKDKMDLTILFRKKNPQGEDVDYIGRLLNNKRVSQIKNFMIGGNI